MQMIMHKRVSEMTYSAKNEVQSGRDWHCDLDQVGRTVNVGVLCHCHSYWICPIIPLNNYCALVQKRTSTNFTLNLWSVPGFRICKTLCWIWLKPIAQSMISLLFPRLYHTLWFINICIYQFGILYIRWRGELAKSCV